ncbi:MAG: DUF4418 family protein [Atopobiaceae bacterium]|nr:DUF4418 family protein [Atopobiaceae bacterium]
MENKSQPIVGVVSLALSLLLVVGILSFAGPCGAHDDGSVSSCFWAGRALLGIGAVSMVLSLVRVFERDEGERRGLSLAIACLGVLVACVPGTLIDLCVSQAMRCHAIMQPFAMGVGIALLLVGGIDLTRRLLKLRHA